MSSGTQRSRIADQLLRDIRSGRYEAGQRLPSERQMSEALGVSRPVIREALGMLSSLGLVDVQIGRGAFVTAKDITAQSQDAQRSLIDVTVVREVLETGALTMAAHRSEVDAEPVRSALAELERCVERRTDATSADHELHRAIVASARSATVLRLWDEHTQEISNVIRISPSGGTMDQSTLDRHRVLANGLLTGDSAAALAACHDLHEDYRRFLRDLLD
jgi:GntR family transcriptional regulator, transcriptional repressor for pyruvate dehydrogenase complex